MTETIIRPGWQDAAACRGADQLQLFYPGTGEPTEPAKRICRMCPVRVDCLEYALEREPADHTRHGIWGGVSAKERKQIARCRTSSCEHLDRSLCTLGVE